MHKRHGIYNPPGLKFIGTGCGSLRFEELSEEHDLSKNVGT
jgi:hypothetical protein